MELRVKDICKEKGVLMEELADKIGITRATLTRNINGNPTVETLSKIANALNVPITELFERPGSSELICPNCGVSLELRIKDHKD